MDIKYGEFNFKHSGIPTPRVTVSYQPQNTSAGRQLGSVVDISMKGQIYGTGSSGVIKASGLAYAFSQDYQALLIQCEGTQVFPPLGNQTTDFDKSIYVKDIKFSNSTDKTMYNIVDFDISMAANIRDTQHYLYEQEEDGPVYLRNLSDSWNISEVKDKFNYLVSVEGDDPENATAYYPDGTHENPLSNTYYNISRVVNAEGIAHSDATAFENAKDGVKLLLKKAPGVFQQSDVLGAAPDANTIKIFNRVTNYEADAINGSLTYTETYIAFTGAPAKKYTHDFNISNSIDKEFNRTVTINGTIQGYDLEENLPDDTNDSADKLVGSLDPYKIPNDGFIKTRQGPSKAYVHASGGLSKQLDYLYGKVRHAIGLPSGEYIDKHDDTQSYPDFKIDQEQSNHSPKTEREKWLHPVPTSFSADHDVNNGSITYTCSYDNRVFTMIPGALNEQLSVNDTYAVTGYATQNIMYRGAHPQHLGTITTPGRTVSYSATFDSIVPDSDGEGDLQTVLSEDSYMVQELGNAMNSFDPKYMDPNYADPVNRALSSWVTEDQFEINFVEGTLNKTISWNYTIWR
tara:strand:- start:3223 stop:4938 length:1716 start_codon:yes stop_codon:yes gene_type:complete